MGSTGSNLGYNSERLNNIENIRNNAEINRIAQEASAQKQLGERSWQPKLNEWVRGVSHDRVSNEIYNAPKGTVLRIYNRDGDYVADYTKTASGWSGSQAYKSNYVTPTDAKTPKSLAMRIAGFDIKVVKVGE